MVYNKKYDLAHRLISDILSQQEILLSINSRSGSIAEARIEKGLPFRIQDKWATIGGEKDHGTFILIWMKSQKLDSLKK